MKTPILVTERLLLRPVKIDDVKQMFDCWMKDESVSRYMCWKASDNINDAKEFVLFELGNVEKDSWYRWIIQKKESNEIIGTCLLFFNDDKGENHWDVSYNLGAMYWGNGYNTEAMKKVMQFAASTLEIKECITSYAKVNVASARVLEKLGFEYMCEEPYIYCNGEKETIGIRVKWKKH